MSLKVICMGVIFVCLAEARLVLFPTEQQPAGENDKGIIFINTTVSTNSGFCFCVAASSNRNEASVLLKQNGSCHNLFTGGAAPPAVLTESFLAASSKTSSCRHGDGRCSWSAAERPWCFAAGGFRIHVYNVTGAVLSSQAQAVFDLLRGHPLHTEDASRACVLFPALDTLDISNRITVGRQVVTAPLFSHPLWRGGKANIVMHFGDHAVPFPVGLAALAKSSLLGRPGHTVQPQLVANPHDSSGRTAYIQASRVAYDVTMPLMYYRCGLPADSHFAVPQGVQLLPADKRPIKLSFQGAAYDTLPDSPVAARIRLVSLDNDKDVRVRLSCAQVVPDCQSGKARSYGTSKHPKCAQWGRQLNASTHANAGFAELLRDSAFVAVVQGEGAHSYRVIEALREGAIPVLLDNAAAPFASAFARTWERAAVFWDDSSDYGLYRLLQHLRSLPGGKLLDMQAAGRSVFTQLLASHEMQVYGLVTALQRHMQAGSAQTQNAVLGSMEPSVQLWPWSRSSAALPPRLPLKTSYETDKSAWQARDGSASFAMTFPAFQSLTLSHLGQQVAAWNGTALLRRSRTADSQREGLAFMRLMVGDAYRWGSDGQYVQAARRILQWLGFHRMDVHHQQRFQQGVTGFWQSNTAADGEQCYSALAAPAENHMLDDPFATLLGATMVAEMYGHGNMWREGLTALQLSCSAMASTTAMGVSNATFFERTHMTTHTLVALLTRHRHRWLVQSGYNCPGGPKNTLQHGAHFATACDDSTVDGVRGFHHVTRVNLRTMRQAYRQLVAGGQVSAIPAVGLRGPEPLPTCTFGDGRATAAGAAHVQPAIPAHTTRVKNNIAIVTLCHYPVDKSNITRTTAANRAAYTARHGYANLFHTQLPSSAQHERRPPAWYKVHYTLEALNAMQQPCEHDDVEMCRAYDWVVWLDCDSLVMNGELKIEELLWGAAYAWESKRAPLTRQAQLVQLLHGSHRGPDLVISEDGAMVNTGVYAVRNSPWSRRFVQRWWTGENSNVPGRGEVNAFVNHTWWEQAALLHAMVLGPDAPSIAHQTVYLPQSWLNPYPLHLADKLRLADGSRGHAKYEEGDWLVSFSGCGRLLNGGGCKQLVDEFRPVMVQ